jgi:hypothetical protein
MTPTPAAPSATYRADSRIETIAPARRQHPHRRREWPAHDQRPLGGYADGRGELREVIACSGAGGTTLVIDRDRVTHGDARLVAHLAADESATNATLICELYLRDAAARDCRCRLVTAEDALIAPFADRRDPCEQTRAATLAAPPLDRCGRTYSLERVSGDMSIPELRWCRGARDQGAEHEPLSLREAIAALESYEPVCALTLHALALHRDSGEVSTTVLRAELVRIRESPIVLNRRLRDVVLGAVRRQELSMSEIAVRCGRVKRDRKGNESGETSWLARRIGLAPEGGHDTPTPWIHSDVLGLIARRGLGISPREVEP